jgi:hypothetical protein
MPSFDYSRIQSTASRLLARFAQGTVTLTRTTPGTPDPSTPWIPAAPTVATYTLDATVAAVGDKFVDGTTILATDRMVTAAAFGTEPGPGDTLSIDGKVVTIVKQMRVPAAGTLVAWRFIVRG